MKAYIITKEQCQVTKSRRNFTSNLRTREALFDEIDTGDRDPEELFRYNSIEEAQAKFQEIVNALIIPEEVKFGSYNNFLTAFITVYELYEWNVDDDGEIIDGGDVWERVVV